MSTIQDDRGAFLRAIAAVQDGDSDAAMKMYEDWMEEHGVGDVVDRTYCGCSQCVFLGVVEADGHSFDAFWCLDERVVSTFSHDGKEHDSAVAAWCVARSIAKDAGFAVR